MTRERGDRRPVREPAAVIAHVGGITDELGGVDPEVDSNLVRLSGGP